MEISSFCLFNLFGLVKCLVEFLQGSGKAKCDKKAANHALAQLITELDFFALN